MKNYLFALIALCAMLGGCIPESDLGRPVKFSARARGVLTKTAYSGFATDAETGTNYAVIAWSASDRIRIYSPSGGPVSSANLQSGFYFYDYGLTGISTPDGGHVSEATLTQTGNGLVWASESGSAKFYSVYPYDLSVSPSGDENQYLSALITIPETQDGGSDISGLPLVSRAYANPDNDVVLEFHPAFSTFEFRIKSDTGSGSITLNSFTLSTKDDPANTAYVAGKGYYNIESQNFTYDSPLYRSATVTFSPKPVITESQETTFSIFTLPVKLSQMTITVNYTRNGVTAEKHLDLTKNGAWLTFHEQAYGPGHFVRIYGLALKDDFRFYMDPTFLVEPLGEKSHVINY